jgi:hypothetical protein
MQRTYRFALPVIVVLLLLGGTHPSLSQPILAVKLVSVTSPARPGTDATIVVATAPNAECTITVIYKSGASRAKGLVPETADAQGKLAWTWRVGTRTTPGTWPIIVTCSSGARSGKLETSFDVI